MKFERILVPVDGSELAKRAFKYAVSLARQYHSKITTLLVVDDQSLGLLQPYALPHDVLEGIEHEVVEKGKESLMRFVAEVPYDGVEIEYAVFQGDAAEEIILFSKQSPTDLIVIGTHGRSGLAHLMLGSVTEEVVRRAGCPVLSVRKETPEPKD